MPNSFKRYVVSKTPSGSHLDQLSSHPLVSVLLNTTLPDEGNIFRFE